MLKQIAARPGTWLVLKSLLIFIAAALLTGWLLFTPAGLLGKADAVGYAVCHRITVRSFLIGERQFPLCARCSGMYLGALVGLLFHLAHRRKAGMPPRKFLAVLAVFVLAFAVDGGNSYLHLFPNFTGLYQPTNFLRLLTGTGIGLGIAAVLVPVVRQTLWTENIPAPAIATWRDFGIFLLLAVLIDLAMLSNSPLLLFPLAVLSTATILVVLTLVYTLIWVMVAKRENQFTAWKQLWPLLLAGFITALAQIAAMDYLRFLWTGSWDGFHF